MRACEHAPRTHHDSPRGCLAPRKAAQCDEQVCNGCLVCGLILCHCTVQCCAAQRCTASCCGRLPWRVSVCLHQRSGMLAKDTICAEMAFMFMERNRAGSTIDYPLGGSGAIVAALLRGLERHGGRLLLRARVRDILLEGAACCVLALHARHDVGDHVYLRDQNQWQIMRSA